MPVSAPKAFYTINEVAQLADVKPHVLRYWETEFKELSPEKNPAGQRIYRQRDLDVVLRIRELLYAEKYTTEGARQRLEEDLARARRAQMPLELNLRESEMTSGLVKAKRMVRSLLDDLSKDLGEEPEPAEKAAEPAQAQPEERKAEPAPKARPAALAAGAQAEAVEGDLLEGLAKEGASAEEPPA
jgi:DNA-binding transcriptional MerR regulator